MYTLEESTCVTIPPETVTTLPGVNVPSRNSGMVATEGSPPVLSPPLPSPASCPVMSFSSRGNNVNSPYEKNTKPVKASMLSPSATV